MVSTSSCGLSWATARGRVHRVFGSPTRKSTSRILNYEEPAMPTGAGSSRPHMPSLHWRRSTRLRRTSKARPRKASANPNCQFRRGLLDRPDQLARQEALRAARLNLLVASRRFSQADSSIEDALGLLETGDQPTALLAASIAFTFVVDGLVAAEGELSPNPKWRAEKVRCAQSNALSWDEYWDLETRRHLDPAQPEPWIRHVLARCQELMLSLDFE